MSSPRRLAWALMSRLTVIATVVSVLVVLGGGTALWWVEGRHPGSTMDTWGDALWWSVTTMTTVGYGDHVPVTTAGRLIATGVMVAGVAIIGGVAAGVALVVARRVAREEEEALQAEAETLEQRLEARLARIESRLDRIIATVDRPAPTGDRDEAPGPPERL